MGHIVKSYDSDLENLKHLLISMMETNLDQLNLLYSLLSNFSKERYNQVCDIDIKINELDNRIIQESIKILSLRNPVAYDLRFVFSASHVSSNLERVGDNAKAIAGYIKKAHINNEKEINEHFPNMKRKDINGEYHNEMFNNVKPYTLNEHHKRLALFGRSGRRDFRGFDQNIENGSPLDVSQVRSIVGVLINKYLEIVHILIEMIHLTIDSFNYMDVDLYKKVNEMDLTVDTLSSEVSNYLLHKIHMVPEKTPDIRLHFLVNRNLERMGDHIVASCRYVNFIENNRMRND